MDEVKRFVRYILPGWACIIELSLALFLSNPSQVNDILKKLTENKGGYEAIGLIIGAFLASGGLGYLFSIIYFFFREIPFLGSWMFINHRVLFNNNKKVSLFPVSVKRETIPKKLVNWILKRQDFKPKSKRDAWILEYLYWHFKEKEEKNKKLKSLALKINQLTDQVHGLGITLVGSLLTYGFWISFFEKPLKGRVSIGWLIFIGCILFDFLFTLKKVQAITNSALIETMMKDENKKESIEIYFAR